MAVSKINIPNISLADANARILEFLQAAQYQEAEKLSVWLLTNSDTDLSEPNFYLGVALQFQGKIAPALQAFNKAHALQSQNVHVIQAIASCFEQLKQYNKAQEWLLLAWSIAPEEPTVNANIGSILEKLGKPHEALIYYDHALTIDPKNYTALLNKGSLLSSLKRKLECLTHSRQAYEIHSNAVGTLYNLVDALLGTFSYEEALVYCELGLASNPRHANFLFKKGLILSCLKRFAEAEVCLAEAQILDSTVITNFIPFLSKDPNVEVSFQPLTLYLDAMLRAQTMCYWQHRNEYIDIWREIVVDSRDENQVVRNVDFAFHILSFPLSSKIRSQFLRDATEWVQDLAWLQGVNPFQYERAKRKKIRVGYLSSDFRMHPTGLLSKQMYDLHNKDSFEIYIYSMLKADENDDVRKAVKTGCTKFFDVETLNDGVLAKKINEDEIDILVDLNGYTTNARSQVMAMRPAPIQVQYLSYIQSMGADFIDYTILDNNVCPKEYEQYWHEKIAKMPHCFYPYDTETETKPIQKTRQEFGLPESAFVFCCLNTSYKIEPDIFDVWMKILHAVPDSVLWLLGPDELTIENLTCEAINRGVTKERIIFAQPLPIAEHLARYQLADLFIDTFWYGAHTTGLDALWQGLPVLYCEGEVSTSRVGASYMKVLEMPELVTQNFEEYQEKAIYYGTHPLALKALKQKLKEQKESTLLFNTPLTVKHIEAAYQHMWQRYQDGLPPETFDVPDLSHTIN